jgi:hypothetical protein
MKDTEKILIGFRDNLEGIDSKSFEAVFVLIQVYEGGSCFVYTYRPGEPDFYFSENHFEDFNLAVEHCKDYYGISRTKWVEIQ